MNLANNVRARSVSGWDGAQSEVWSRKVYTQLDLLMAEQERPPVARPLHGLRAF